MTNNFKYSSDNKRYHTWNYHLQQKFGQKVFKVSLNAGFTCPNIDGTKGYGGCIYCSSSGSGDFAGNPCDDILTQFDEVKSQMHKKWPEA
ncbi:MAG: TIGR01212 family radical SAM protein, partial [Clostridia bacterium]|nr:TIGR01212 family radical SAM protein [Clostridia bacterium]